MFLEIFEASPVGLPGSLTGGVAVTVEMLSKLFIVTYVREWSMRETAEL